MRKIIFMLLCLQLVCVCVCYDMIVGDIVHHKMVYHERVKTYAIPLKKRIKTLTYVDPQHRRISGIKVIDNDFSYATANVTDGGVGSPHAAVRMKSQRSHPLNYEVEVYV